MIDIKQAQKEAQDELQEEILKEAKTQIKAKLKQLKQANKVVKNIERELVDLYDEIGTDLADGS